MSPWPWYAANVSLHLQKMEFLNIREICQCREYIEPAIKYESTIPLTRVRNFFSTLLRYSYYHTFLRFFLNFGKKNISKNPRILLWFSHQETLLRFNFRNIVRKLISVISRKTLNLGYRDDTYILSNGHETLSVLL